MDETERHSALVSEIYDTALDPTLWPGVLKKSARFVGGSYRSDLPDCLDEGRIIDTLS